MSGRERGALEGCRGLVVKASGWQSFGRQFEPCLRAFMPAPVWCGLGCRCRTDGGKHTLGEDMQAEKQRRERIEGVCEIGLAKVLRT